VDYNRVVKVIETKKTSNGKKLNRLVQKFNSNEDIIQELIYCYDFDDGAEFLREKTELRYTDIGKIKSKYKFTGHYPSDPAFFAKDFEKMITYEYDAKGRIIKAIEERDNESTEGRNKDIVVFEYFEDGTKIGKRYAAEFYNNPKYHNYITEYYDEAGNLILEDAGYLKKFWRYDDSGNLIEESWRYEEPYMDYVVGVTFPMFRKEYDERGNEIASFHYKLQTEEVSWETHSVFNEQNQMIQSSMIDHGDSKRNHTSTYEYEVSVHGVDSDETKGKTSDICNSSGQLLIKRAENGNVRAILEAAKNYLDGTNGFPADLELAFQWCKKGLDIDVYDAELWVQLAHCHEKANTDADKGAAHKAYRCAAELGHVSSMYIVAEDIYYGSSEDKKPECLSWLERAAASQDERAETLLGYIYLRGEFQTNNRQRGIELLTKAAERGDCQGAFILGEAYLHQIDGSEQAVAYIPGNASKYFAIAVENGEDRHKALYYAGIAYFYGEGVPKSMEKARKCLEALIDDADVPEKRAFGLLGCMCFEGVGGPVDYTLGEKALRRAMRSDDTEVSLESTNNLGMYLYNLTNRLPEAIQLLQSAANQGYADAQVNLGKAYYDGKGVPQNAKTAAHYFGLAARQGNQTAIDNLKVMGMSNNSSDNSSAKKRHPIRGAIIGYFVGGIIAAIPGQFSPVLGWAIIILAVIIGIIKG